jgi:hypothetical protein
MPKPSTQPSRDTMIRELNSILDQLEALSKKSRKYDRKIISPMSDAKLKTQLSEAKRKLAEKTAKDKTTEQLSSEDKERNKTYLRLLEKQYKRIGLELPESLKATSKKEKIDWESESQKPHKLREKMIKTLLLEKTALQERLKQSADQSADHIDYATLLASAGMFGGTYTFPADPARTTHTTHAASANLEGLSLRQLKKEIQQLKREVEEKKYKVLDQLVVHYSRNGTEYDYAELEKKAYDDLTLLLYAGENETERRQPARTSAPTEFIVETADPFKFEETPAPKKAQPKPGIGGFEILTLDERTRKNHFGGNTHVFGQSEHAKKLATSSPAKQPQL